MLPILLLACAQPTAEMPTDPSESAPGAIEATLLEGSPEALGVLDMLNDASTTLTVLDVDAGLDRRAAAGLIAHRDGADGVPGTADDNPFDSVHEVDAVPYVGDSALAHLLDYARAHGWVDAGEDYYGTVETVSFTTTEATAVVELANTADQATLDDDVGLDSRAATNLVAGRPYTTLEQVAAVRYVGASALAAMKDWVDAAAAPTLGTADAVAALNTDVAGLWFTSESDYPLQVWQIAAPSTTTLTTANVKTVLASAYVARDGSTSLAARSVEASSLSWMFDRYTVPADWWEDSNRADQPRWQAVRDVFEDQLESVTVWRFGRRDSLGNLVGDIDVFVVGVTADGDLVGIRTVSVET
jgi:DNA uptake protein ComE-like DNA-binding protein